jgi:hypothetical protein
VQISGSALREDHAAARAAQGLVRGGGHHVRVGHGLGIDAGCNEAGDMRHVDEQPGTDLVGDSRGKRAQSTTRE